MDSIKFVHFHEIAESQIIDLMNNERVGLQLPLLAEPFTVETRRSFVRAKAKLWQDHGASRKMSSCSPAPLPSPAAFAEPEAAHAMVVLDASGSTRGKVGRRQKMKIAREALGQLVKQWDPETQLGLMVYGHSRKGDCNDIEVLIAPSRVDPGRFARAAKNVRPRGKTPLTQSVLQAAKALQSTKRRATVILISDGKETCDTDPCAVGRQLENEGVDFTAHVIGFMFRPRTQQACAS